jgi:hypothetical protein
MFRVEDRAEPKETCNIGSDGSNFFWFFNCVTFVQWLLDVDAGLRRTALGDME